MCVCVTIFTQGTVRGQATRTAGDSSRHLAVHNAGLHCNLRHGRCEQPRTHEPTRRRLRRVRNLTDV